MAFDNMSNFELLCEYFKTAKIGDEFKAKDITLGMKKQFGVNPSSIIPSDYCYNRKNKAPYIPERVMFEYIKRGKYRYLGLGYPYTGEIVHKQRGQDQEKVVGSWLNGQITLYNNI